MTRRIYAECPHCEANFPIVPGQGIPRHRRRPTDQEVCPGSAERPPIPSHVEAHNHAARLVAHLALAGIRASAWSRATVGARVYIGRDAWISVSRGGDLSYAHRGASTFRLDLLYPSQRPKFEAARAAYRAETDRIFEAATLATTPVAGDSSGHPR